MKNLTKHPMLVDLAKNLIERVPETNRFIANRMDPTLVVKGRLDISKKISITTCSAWGTELTLKVGKEVFVNFYLDGNEVIFRQSFNKMHYKYLRSLIKRFPEVEYQN